MPEIFYNINDLAEMEQANVKEGWEPPVVNPSVLKNVFKRRLILIKR